MDVACNSNDVEFPEISEFGDNKAIPFLEVQTHKVYQIVKFKEVKTKKKEELILKLVDAEKNIVECWATSLIRSEFNEKREQWSEKQLYIISKGRKKHTNPLRDFYYDFKILYK